MLRKFIPFGISLVLLAFIGLVSAGAGHGDLILATLLFPFPIIVAKLITPFMGCSGYGDCFPRDHIVFLVALLQFPMYGMLFSLVSHRKLLAAGIAIFHLVFFFVFYILMDPLGAIKQMSSSLHVCTRCKNLRSLKTGGFLQTVRLR